MSTRPRRSMVAAAQTAIAVTALMTGCVAQTDAGPSLTPTVSSATPEPTPTPTSTVDPAAVVAFDGDCSAMFGDDEVAGLLGSEPAPANPGLLVSQSPDLNASLSLIGAIACSWPGGVRDFLYVAVVPESVVPPAVVAETATPSCEERETQCQVTRSVDGSWILAVSTVKGAPGRRARRRR